MADIDWSKLSYLGKTLTYISGLLLLAISIVDFVSIDFSPRIFFQRAFYIIFAAKLVACEFGIQFMLSIFPYMKYYLGKGLFMMFAGSLMINNSFSVGFILGLCLMGVGLFTIFIGGCTSEHVKIKTTGL